MEPTTLAREIGVTPSTITRPLNNPKIKGGWTLKNLRKIEKVTGHPIPQALLTAMTRKGRQAAVPPPSEAGAGIDALELGYEIEVGGEMFVCIPAFDARISAGSQPENTNGMVYRLLFRSTWLRRYTSADFRDLAVVEAASDAMAPTIRAGDSALLDRSQRSPRQQDGVYVLRRDGGPQIKRLKASFRGNFVDVISDNPAYPPDIGVPVEDLDVCGRVLWIGQRI